MAGETTKSGAVGAAAACGVRPSAQRPITPMKCTMFLLTIVSLLAGQSFFNTQGLGELMHASDAQSVALAAPHALSNWNPGMLVVLPQTRISFTGLGAVSIARRNSLTRAVGNLRPSGVWGVTPLPCGFRFSLSLFERFNQDFDIWTESTATTPYWYHIVSRGGIYTLGANLTASLLNHLGLGLGYNRTVGGSREDWNFITGDNRYRSTDTIELNWSGSMLLGGVSFQHPYFVVATVFEPTHTLQGRRFKRVHGAVSDTEQLFTIRLPLTISVGASIQVNRKLCFQLGAERRPWAKSLLNNSTWRRLRDVWRLSLGLELNLIEEHPLRLGYAHDDWYFWNELPNTPEPSPILEHSLHWGTSFPIRRFGTTDLAIALAMRKNRTPAGTMYEEAFKMSVTLAYSEAWLKRTRRWGY
ncbi:MAG: hypothetical protein ABIK43_03835 [candidate division WOR-3 bacterium]